MREKDLHKIIREKSSDNNTELYNALSEKHPELARKEKKKDDSHKKLAVVLTAIFAPVTAVFAAVAFINVFLLRDSSFDGQHGASVPSDDASLVTHYSLQYDHTQMNYTVKEYNEIYGTDFLCFDGEYVAEYRVTEFSHKNTHAFLGLKSVMTDRETGYVIDYTVCKAKSPLDFLVYNMYVCTNYTTVSDCSVKWGVAKGDSYGIFDYDGYSYYITLKSDPDETRLFELIDILLST